MRIQLFVWLILAASAAWAQPSRVNPTGTETGLNLPTQRIGPDDLLNIAVYDSPELTHSVRVDQSGFIRLPMVPQPVKAAGLLPGELEAGVAQALVAGKILVNPVVTVTIAEYRSRPVSVVGAVKKPLTFQAFGEVTLLDAIARAEGLTEYAGPEVLVTQSEADEKGETKKLVRRIRVKELIDDANPALNLSLHGGEEIRVPEMGKVFVVGSVKKPGVFPVQEAAGTSVLKILAYSEGLSP
jgi:polysaccharide export outer membrane protein